MCLSGSRCPADPASPVAGLTGIAKRHVYTGPNPNGFGPRGTVRLSSPVRAYVGECNLRIVLEQQPIGSPVTVVAPALERAIVPKPKGLSFAHFSLYFVTKVSGS